MERELFPRKPPQDAGGETREIPWAPRPQQPSDTYASLRRFRAAEQLARSGELAAVPPPADESSESPMSDDTDTTSPGDSLPRPGVPLFGPHGIVSQPIAGVPRPSQTVAATTAHIVQARRDSVEITSSTDETGATKRVTVVTTATVVVKHLTLPSLPIILAVKSAITTPRLPEKTGWVPSSYHYRAFYGLTAVILLITFVAYPLISAFAQQPPLPPHTYTIKPFAPGPIYLPVTLDVDHPPPVVWAESAFVMDESNGAVLYTKNPDEQLPMASTTKLMTAVVAMAHAKPDTIITITSDAVNTDCTCFGLHVGEQYTLQQLLYGMLMPSGNDAAVAIADGVAGNVKTFAGWMNATATAIGMNNTHFVNPNGLPSDTERAYSSAHDLAVLGRYALSLPAIHEASRALTYTVPASPKHPEHKLSNEHEPLWWYPGADGGKPGWTQEAQFVDILSAERDGHHIIAVLMRGKNDWVTDIRDLLNWGFDNFTWVSPREIDKQHWIPFDDSYQYFAWDVPTRTLQVGDSRYFPYTGFSVTGSFLTYFDAKQGLPTFGFPTGMPVPGAPGTLVQQFQNAKIQCVVATGTCQTA